MAQDYSPLVYKNLPSAWDSGPGAINILPEGVIYYEPRWGTGCGTVRCSFCGGNVVPTEMSGNCPNCAGRLP